MDGAAWWATIHGVEESQTRLSNFTFTFSLSLFFFFATGLVGSYFPIRDHPMPPAVRAWSPDHWAVREFPVSYTCSWFSSSLPPLFFLRIFFLHSMVKHFFWKSIDLYSVTVLLCIASFLNALITKVPLSTS